MVLIWAFTFYLSYRTCHYCSSKLNVGCYWEVTATFVGRSWDVRGTIVGGYCDVRETFVRRSWDVRGRSPVDLPRTFPGGWMLTRADRHLNEVIFIKCNDKTCCKTFGSEMVCDHFNGKEKLPSPSI